MKTGAKRACESARCLVAILAVASLPIKEGNVHTNTANSSTEFLHRLCFTCLPLRHVYVPQGHLVSLSSTYILSMCSGDTQASTTGCKQQVPVAFRLGNSG